MKAEIHPELFECRVFLQWLRRRIHDVLHAQ